ncbi:hypothetical protein MSAN_02066100 [Mycena sanguinolenta]|uniref:F-box domain-containing protein n=1 Tax=Mycena sanguinolenta TaxID=230812 RepID=A0A8H6XI69_9AGAR|nr:hypothetical protein MSAN_02066100 [Mycena sanguinolenta]
MRSSTVSPLNDDIVGQIMAFCPTFNTLLATILVSKAFHRVFQTHPKSIIRAVSYNVVGPALPQALRVIRYPYHDYCTPKDDPSAMAGACPEDWQNLPVICADEISMLEENARVVGELENIYSLMAKDRMSKTSVLTAEESWRFRRAMYRIMLYCAIFSSFYYDFAERAGELEAIQNQRTAVLAEYPTDELRQVSSAVEFLSQIHDGSIWRGVDLDTFLSACPSGALRVWEARSADVLLDIVAGDSPHVDRRVFQDSTEEHLECARGDATRISIIVKMDFRHGQWS